MKYSDFNFLSTAPKDKLAFHYSGTRSIPAWSEATFTIPHDVTAPFVPIIRYTTNGTDWYYNGDGKESGMYRELQMRADAGSDNVRVNYFGGPNALNATYEIYGISRNV